MKNCSECNQPTDATFRSGLVPDEVCGDCYNRLAREAVQAACNPKGDKTPLQKQAVTTDKVEAAIKESIS